MRRRRGEARTIAAWAVALVAADTALWFALRLWPLLLAAAVVVAVSRRRTRRWIAAQFAADRNRVQADGWQQPPALRVVRDQAGVADLELVRLRNENAALRTKCKVLSAKINGPEVRP